MGHNVKCKNNQIVQTYIEGLYADSFQSGIKAVVFDAAFIGNRMADSFFENKPDIIYYSHTFSINEVLYPYHSFLVCIRDFFRSISKDECKRIFKDINIYSLHVNLYLDFFYMDSINRDEEVFLDEVYYENLRFHEDICHLLTYISKFHHMVFYLGNLHLCGESTIGLLTYILRERMDMKILFVMSFDMDIRSSNQDNRSFSQFLEIIEEKDMMMYLNSKIYESKECVKEKSVSNTEIWKAFLLNYYFLAIDDCIEYGKMLYLNYISDPDGREKGMYVSFLKLFGKCYYLKNDTENALLFHNMALEKAIDLNNNYEMCDLKVDLGYDYLLKEEYQIAIKCAQDAYLSAKENGFEEVAYRSSFLQYRISEYLPDEFQKMIAVDLEILIRITKEKGYEHYLSYIYTNSFVFRRWSDKDRYKYFELGLQISKKLGNDHQLSTAYHNYGMIYSKKGNNSKAYEYYLKSQKIKKKIGDLRHLSYIYNSLGYYFFIEEFYGESYNWYLESLKAASEANDFHEAGMTIYNLAVNALCFGKYNLVCNYIMKLLKLMRFAKISDLRYHSKNMIYNIYIIALLKRGKSEKAKDLYAKLKICQLPTVQGNKEERFIEEMQKFFMHYHESCAYWILIDAEKYVHKKDRNMIHFRKFYTIEKILFFKQYFKDKYIEALEIAKYEFGSAEYPYTKKILDDIERIWESEESLLSDRPIEEVDNIYEKLIYMARIDQNMNRLKDQINEISFLNLVQTMLVNEEDAVQVVLRLQKLIYGNTKVDKLYCRMSKEKGFKDINLDNNMLVIHEVYADRIFNGIQNRSKPSLFQQNNRQFSFLKKVYQYSSLIYLPIYVNGSRKFEFIFLTQGEEDSLTQDDLNLLTLAAKQTGQRIERIESNQALKEMNIKLKRLSDTDLLTGLNNRHSLEERLHKEQERINKHQIESMSILFLDLDNFKYYNDSFGHRVGDQILVYFANILKEVVGEKNFVARFGGDEFVILLIDMPMVQGDEILKKIREKIESLYYFERIVGHILGKRITIPKEHRLSCSIGMSSLIEDINSDVDDLLKQSDLALYNAKRNGKNRLSEYKYGVEDNYE